MAIADTIQSMYTNVGEVYDTITNVSLPEHKNIENIPSTIRDSYLEIMNNGIDVVWDNWEKVVGEGTELTLSNTEHAPMKVLLKGNTYQDSTTGKNLFNINGTPTNTACTYSVSNNELTQTNSGTYSRTTWTIDNLTIGQNYTLSFSYKNSSASTIAIMIRNSADTTTIANTTSITNTSGTETLTFTATETTHKIRFYSNQTNTSNTSVVIFSNIQLESGSSQTSYEPYTNGASPNPDYPQEVHVVSGDNEVEVVGKNLFDDNEVPNNSTYATDTHISNGKRITTTLTGNGYYQCRYIVLDIKKYIGKTFRLKANYVASGNNVPAYTIGICDSEGNNRTSKGTATTSGTVLTYTATQDTITDTKHYLYVILYVNAGGNATSGEYADFTNITMTIDNEDMTYTPYTGESYPINLPEGMFLGSIGDYQDRFFKTSGKNIYDPSNLKIGSINTTTGQEETSYYYSISQDFIEVEPSGTYNFQYAYNYSSITGQIVVYQYDANKSFIRFDASNTKDYNLTLRDNTKYVKCRFKGDTNHNNNVSEYEKMQIAKGTSIPYEPYGSNEWYLEKKIGKYTFTGNETSITTWTNDRVVINQIPVDYMKVSNTTLVPLYCTHYKAMTRNDSQTTNNAITFYSTQDTSNSGSIIHDSTHNTNNLLRTWLQTLYQSNTPVELYYVLATPTYTKIEGTLASQLEALNGSKSYTPQTNISQTNDDLPFALSVSALKQI